MPRVLNDYYCEQCGHVLENLLMYADDSSTLRETVRFCEGCVRFTVFKKKLGGVKSRWRYCDANLPK